MLNVYQSHLEAAHRGWPRWVFPVVIALSLLGVAGVGFGWSAARRTKQVRQSVSEDYISLRQGIARDFQFFEERLSQTEESTAQLRGQLNVVTKRLQLSPEEQAEARRMAEQIRRMNAQQLAKLNTALRSELNNKASGSELKAVSARFSNEVASVRTDVSGAKNDLQATLSELNKRVARNQQEIEGLRTVGQHTDYDFLLNGKGAKKTMAGITVELRDANLKKNQFSVTLSFGKTRLVQKNRSLDEPIFFYTPSGAAPMELVVNQLGKNRVAGRLSVPKSNLLASTAESRQSP